MNLKYIAWTLVGLLIAGGLTMDVINLSTEPEVVTAEGETITGPAGSRGARGISGADGKDGKQGIQGVMGVQGPMGEAPSIEDVLAALDEREAAEDEPNVYSGGAGNYSNSIELDDEDYDIAYSHFGSGDFQASLVDEDGNVFVIADLSGHNSGSVATTTVEGDFELKVSADGPWEIEIDKQ